MEKTGMERHRIDEETNLYYDGDACLWHISGLWQRESYSNGLYRREFLHSGNGKCSGSTGEQCGRGE